MKTSQKILNAALTILMENGFQALTQTRVAEVAGVSQGNLTYHFPTRNDLLKAVVDESKLRMNALRAAELQEGKLTWSSLEAIMVRFALSKAMPRLMLTLTVARDEDPSLAEWFAKSDLQTRQNFRALLAQLNCQVDEATVFYIRATIIGASLIHLQQNSEESEQIARTAIKKAFEYLKHNVKPLLPGEPMLSE